MHDKLQKLQLKLNIKFKNIELLKEAITHKSYDKSLNYEKLEFLGDRVLGLSLSKKLIDLYPDEREGVLDKKLASLVNKETCYEIGKKIELDKFVLVDGSKHKNQIEQKIISDTCESIIGAIFIEKGFNYTQKFIFKLWKDFIDNSATLKIDAKTKLQEYSLKKFKSLPIYKMISNTGPKHNPIFKIAVKIKGAKYIEGSGSSKKLAEQNAAENFFKLENV